MARPDPDILVFIPPSQRWLRSLLQALQNRAVHAQQATIADHRLRMVLRDGGGQRLALTIWPRTAGQPGLVATRHFTIATDGVGELSRSSHALLDVFVRQFRRFEPSIPRSLDGFASMTEVLPAPGDTISALYPFLTIERSSGPGSAPAGEMIETTEVMIRVTSRCNQRCPFCSGPPHDEPPASALADCGQTIARLLPGAMITLSGGEPTLRPDLPDLVDPLLDLDGVGRIQIQTNGLAFAAGLDPNRFPAGEKISFFVSLHAMKEEIYDRCTNTKGHLPQAIRGLKRILSAGHPTIVNTVVAAANLDHIGSDMADLLADAFADGPKPEWHLSVLICPEYNPRAVDHLVRYGDALPILARAVDAARRRGLSVHPLRSSTHASMPPCIIAAHGLDPTGQTYAIEERETSYEGESTPYVKAERCSACADTDRCLGVPRPYAQRFGLTELTPRSGG